MMQNVGLQNLRAEISTGSVEQLLGFAESAFKTIAKDGDELSIVVSGGQIAPRVLTSVLSLLTSRHHVNVIVSDERHTPRTESRNSVQLDETIRTMAKPLSASVSIIAPRFAGTPTESAQQFAADLTHVQSPALAILGVGVDGHIAGLFPHHNLESSGPVSMTESAPEPFTSRVSLSLRFLKSIPNRWAFIVGREKNSLSSRLYDAGDLPVRRLQPTHWFLDVESLHESPTPRGIG